MSKTFTATKDPDDVKDYGINWIPRLETDDIVTSTWSIVTAGSELAMDSDSFNNSDTVDGAAAKTTTVWLSGGVEGSFELLNRITTTGGRTYDQTVKLKIKER